MGSAALFFSLEPSLQRGATLADLSLDLVLTFLAVRDHVEALLQRLLEHDLEHNVRRAGDRAAQREYFERVRARDRTPGWNEVVLGSPERLIEHAARLIYLNKTCFNGLWRVNKRGFYNVPMGRYRRPKIYDPPLLRAACGALQGVTLRWQPYTQAVVNAEAGDVVYFDPPYLPVSATSSFNAYAKEGFLAAQHRELAVIYLCLAARGVKVLMSNSDTPLTRQPLGSGEFATFAAHAEPVLEGLKGFEVGLERLFDTYRTHWNVWEVQATRAINSKGGARGAVTELLISTGCGA